MQWRGKVFLCPPLLSKLLPLPLMKCKSRILNNTENTLQTQSMNVPIVLQIITWSKVFQVNHIKSILDGC